MILLHIPSFKVFMKFASGTHLGMKAGHPTGQPFVSPYPLLTMLGSPFEFPNLFTH